MGRWTARSRRRRVASERVREFMKGAEGATLRDAAQATAAEAEQRARAWLAGKTQENDGK
jgi:hypothetical protein